MAKRDETNQRKTALLNDLRAAQQRGDGRDQTTPLSQRELSARYNLSGQTVSLLLQQLMQEGVLYTIPRIGTFLGRPTADTSKIYLFVTPVSPNHYSWVTQIEAMDFGFAETIAQLGGATHSLSLGELLQHLEEGSLPPVAGIFFFDVPPATAFEITQRVEAPGVIYGPLPDEYETLAAVNFDDRDGGIKATRHLLTSGHRKIAFLGLHGTEDESGVFSWSAQRMDGWCQAMQEVGLDWERLHYLPRTTSPFAQAAQEDTAYEVVMTMLDKIEASNITAVVAVNMYAARGLIKALDQSNLPKDSWPAIVCFDDTPRSNLSGISYLRLPWEKLGAEAAHLAWERQHRYSPAEPRTGFVQMHLIARLSCRSDWASSGLIQTPVLELAVPLAHQTAGVGNAASP